MTLVIATGGIDLPVGSVVALAGARCTLRLNDGRTLRHPLHLATQPHEIRLRNQVLLKFVFLRDHVFRRRVRERFLADRLPIIRESEIDMEGERGRFPGEPGREGFCFPQLFLGEPGDGSPQS